MKNLLAVAMMVALIGPPLRAQDEGGGKVEEAVEDQGSGEETEVGKLLRAIRLPEAAEQARREGVPAGEVKEVLEAARSRELPAGDTEAIMVEETRAVREEGQIENFGSFVRSKLDEGLRGRELSEAIRAEHTARGKGRAPGKPDGPGSARAGTDRPGEGVAEGEDAARGKKQKADRAKGKAEKTQAGEKRRPDGDK